MQKTDMKTKPLLLSFVLLIYCNISYGQSDVEMADIMRSNEKVIHVVVAVALIVMLGLIIYMIALDRKVTAIEKKLKSKN